MTKITLSGSLLAVGMWLSDCWQRFLYWLDVLRGKPPEE